MKMNLKDKMNLIVISFLVLWVGCISFISIFVMRNRIDDAKYEYSKVNIDTIMTKIDTKIENFENDNNELAKKVKLTKKIEVKDLLEKDIQAFYVMDKEKNILFKTTASDESLNNLDIKLYYIDGKSRTGITNIDGYPALVSMTKDEMEKVYISVSILKQGNLDDFNIKDSEGYGILFLTKNNNLFLEELKDVGVRKREKVYARVPLGTTKVISNFVINDYFNKPTVNVNYNFDKQVGPYITKIDSNFYMAIGAINVIFLGLFIYLLNLKVFSRLEKIQHEIDRLDEYKTNKGVHNDELKSLEENLSSVINSLAGYKEQVDFYSKYDNLTGLMKREIFIYEGDQYISEHEDGIIGLIYINLDGFSNYNNSYGYLKGDEILIRVAKILNENIDENSLLSRIGGDEFGILVKTIKSEEYMEKYVKDLLKLLNEFKINDEYNQFISASVGICVKDSKDTTTFEMLNNAYLAMISVKERVKNSYEFFEDFLKNEITIEMMHNGIKNGEIQLYYQPKVNSITNRIDGVEALIRWFHPIKGYIPPPKFIKVAEETGYIITLGDWVLNEACKQIKELNDRFSTEVKVAVNVSSIQFMQNDFVDLLKQALTKWDLNARYLELELTESVGVYNSREVISKFEEINELGVSIAIDDFGTGYSSFKYLQQYKVNTIKIDRSFVQDIENDSGIVKSIIELSHNLGFKVVAEGIENFAQSQKLKQLECDYFQGFFFYKPISVNILSEIIEKYELLRY
ncbi:diguanylate cyclase (GGDEF) domain-containing protein [Clostridium cavendishii DSM 21758]|uniref:Diguanylate cyclase (GGDEF) domain-containing protein n=1 Tax=Clostridium cavendishii DSM 21758 TaxID=1121302 RepID=A0A1M6LU74_9CLOT|nr:GGDEF domain-containing phosphodiesterase [Clostridium cavendishii]SHJ74751.1 diguanylate cyclase (GGDEF) domain-containing protein [Clostridium cavendishii DSM 21758]